jgi:predicted phage terminase large subunit-like protein
MLLLVALRFMQDRHATGVIFRRTSANLTNPGSIWPEAVQVYSDIYKKGLRIRSREHEIIFPNGAVLKFSHMQHEKNMYDHKGAQYSFVAFDEVTEFSEQAVTYLMSRMRNAKVKYKPQMFLTCNPEYDHWLRLWIQDFYLDPLTGIPDPTKAGHVRYFARTGGDLKWYNTRKEAEAVHGTGEESGITSFTFLPATCRDNPPLLKANPGYISQLMSLERVEMERLLHGSWFARQESSGYFKRSWCSIVDIPNPLPCKRVRAWDLAFTKPSEANKNPDFTCGTLMSKDRNGTYTVEDVKLIQDRVNEVETLIFNTAREDGTSTTISIPIDPAAAAGAYAKDLQRRLAELGFSVRLTRPVKSKITRFAPFSSVAQAGFVHVVQSEWIKTFFDQLEIFNGEAKNKDDIVDTCSDAFLLLNKELHLPDMSFTQETVMQSPIDSLGLEILR